MPKRCRCGKTARPGRSDCYSCRGRKARDNAAAKLPYEPGYYGTLARFGTDALRVAAESLVQHGSVVAAAEALGLPPTRLRAQLNELERAAARAGWSPASDVSKPQPPGYHVKGVSSYYGADGELRGQWVKTGADPEDRVARLLKAVEEIAEPFRGAIDPSKAPRHTSEDLLNVFPIGDPHIGMLAWAEETGEDFDIKIAEQNLVAAVDHLVAGAPLADEALVIPLGDFFHTDSFENVTRRSRHSLDVDSRWSKILAVGVRIMRRIVDRCLTRHKRVRVIVEIGNHDDQSSIMLALALSLLYERELRVVIDTSPAKYHWHRHGKCLIGTTHGDTVKAADLPGIMAHDRAADWGETTWRYWYCGHVHHDTLKEYRGVTVETFRTLAARDAYTAAHGYRSGRDLKMIVLHKEYGEIRRDTVGVSYLQGIKK